MKKPAIKWPLNKLVEVDWIDACTKNRWDTVDNYDVRPLECRTAGYLLHLDDKRVVVIQTQSPYNVTDSMTIPRSCVTKIRRLK